MTTARIGRRGQITLPREVRERLQLLEGQRVAFVVKGNDVTLQPLTRTLRSLRGSVGVSAAQDFEQIRAQVKATRAALEFEDDSDA